MEVTIEVPLLLTLVCLACGGAWWMSALYIKVGRIEKRVLLFVSHLVSELGGTDPETGKFTEGTIRENQNVVESKIKDIKNKITKHYQLKEGHKDPFDSENFGSIINSKSSSN